MPYKAPGTDDDRIKWILREIQKSQDTLDKAIADAERLPTSDATRAQRLARYRALKREVDTAFNGLDRNIGVWAQRDIPSLYQSGWAIGATQTGYGFDFTLPHREALDILSLDAYDDVATRLQGVRQGFTDTVDLQELYEGLSFEEIAAIQSSSRSAVAQSLLTGNADPRKVARQLSKDLWKDNPKLQIIDSGGKKWQMQTYTRMLVRTKSANAYNSGSLNKYAEEDVKRVQVFDGVEDDTECAEANGQTWSLRYAMRHVIEHPNCRRAFAPKAGAGPVQKDTAEKNIAVAFDRLELGLTGFAGLRRLRQSGELNLSSTLARLVIEVAEVHTVPLPIIDQYLMGLVSNGLREFDHYVESFIDPVLYHVGLLDHIPERAALIKASRPQTVLDSVADMVSKAAIDAYGTDTNPKVQRVLTSVSDASLHLDRGLNLVKSPFLTQHEGGLKYIQWIADTIIEPTEAGRLTADTLIRMRDGSNTDIIQAYAAARQTLDEFRGIRTLHLQTMNFSWEDARRTYYELDDVINHSAALLAGDDVVYPAARAAREAPDVRPQTARNARRAYEADPERASEGLARRLTEASLQDSNWDRTYSSGVGDGLGSQLDVDPIARFDLTPEWADEVAAINGSVFSVYEMPQTTEAADLFHDLIVRAKKTHKFGSSVTAYDADEYANGTYKLFLTGDGKAGFAVTNDGQLVSVFNVDPDLKRPLHTMVPLSINRGVTRADAFDTVLPKFYAQFGLHPVSRIKFVDEYAPDGWNYELFGKYNDGRPDVVFLKLDTDRIGVPYDPKSGYYVDDYDVGLASTLPTQGTDTEVPQWFLDALKKYGVSVNDQRNLNRGQRQLVDLISEATELQSQLLKRMNDLQDVVGSQPNRALLFPTASGAQHVPTTIGRLWNEADFEQFTDTLADKVANAGIASNRVSLEALGDFTDIMLLVSKDAEGYEQLVKHTRGFEPSDLVIQFMKNEMGYDNLTVAKKGSGLLDKLPIPANPIPSRVPFIGKGTPDVPDGVFDWKNPENVLGVILDLFERLDVPVDGDLRKLTIRGDVSGAIPVDNKDMVHVLGNMMYMFKKDFWKENGDLVQAVIQSSKNKDAIVRHLTYAARQDLLDSNGLVTKVAAARIAGMWNRTIESLQQILPELTEPPVSYATLGAQLERMFGTGNVSQLSAGVHGAVYLVDDTVGKFVVKPLNATGHTGGHSGATASMILNDWTAGILGSDVVPYRVVAMNETDLMVISPFMDNMTESIGAVAEVKNLDTASVRRLNIFHYLTMEGDTNARNFMIGADTKTVLRIDHESSFGFLSSAPRPESSPFGMNNRGEYFVRSKSKAAWVDGKDELFDTDSPVRLYEATDEEVAHWMTLSKDELDQLSVSSRRRAGNQIEGKIPAVMLDGTGEKFHVPTGRIANYQYPTFTGQGDMWVASHSLTDVELAFVERIIRDPDGIADEMFDALTEGTKHVPYSAIDEIELRDLVEIAAENMEYRANKLVSSGLLDLSAGKAMVNTHGTDFAYGNVVKIKRLGKPPPGQPDEIHGLIVNTWEEMDGTRRAGVMHNLGVGKSADDLELDPMQYITVQIDRYIDADTVPIANVRESVRRSRVFGDSLPSPHGVEEVTDAPWYTAWVRQDDMGLAVGLEKGNVTVQFADDAGGELVKVVDDTGKSFQTKMDSLFGLNGREILDSELAKIHPEHRPNKIVLHTSAIEMEDGKLTYGFFDDDTLTAHISMAALQNDVPTDPIVGSIAGMKRTLSDGLRLPPGSTFSDGAGDTRNLKDVFGELNWDAFREVVRHEFSHSVHVRIEETRRIRFRTKIVGEILDEFPDAAALKDVDAARLLPQGFEIKAGETAMQALIEHRVGVLEDIVNTNLAYHGERMLDRAIDAGDVLPSWAHRAHLGIRNQDPDAHHELFAELWAQVAAEGSDAAAIRTVASKLGVTENDLLVFLDPADIALPNNWNILDPEFIGWVRTVLDPKAKRMIPLRSSRSRRLWEQGGFDRDLARKVFGLDDEIVTYNVVTSKFETTGTAVAIKEHEEIISAATDDELLSAMPDALAAFEQKHKAILQTQEYRVAVHKAVNDQTGEVDLYIDAVRVYDDELDAAQFGFAEQQLSMRSIDKGDDVELLSKYADFDEFLEAEYKGKVPYEELIGRTERVAGLKDKKKVKGVWVQSDIRLVDGQKMAPVTMKVFADKDIARIRKIAETRYNIKITDELARENVRRVIAEGLRRYSPAQLKKRYDFYAPWHDGFVELAVRWNTSPSRIMAAAAVISPSRDATNNYAVAYILADIIHKNDKFTRDEIKAMKVFLKDRETKYIGFGKPDRAAMFAAASAGLTSNSRPSDFDSDVLGYVLNDKIKDALPTFRTYTGNVGDGMPVNYKSGERFKLGIINGQVYTDTGMRAIQLIRGEASIDEIMSGAKVRPFVNNIIDPLDHYGNRDITIDYHMVNLMIWATGSNKSGVQVDSSGKIAGIDIGVKGIMADVLRELFDEGLGDELEIVSDAQLQEILWGLWRDGLNGGWWDGVRRVEVKKK